HLLLFLALLVSLCLLFIAMAPPYIYTLSLHDALPILSLRDPGSFVDVANPTARVGDNLFKGSGTSQAAAVVSGAVALLLQARPEDRKSTRLNSSHVAISYAVFCLKKKTGATQRVPQSV